jgi:hypothetical protein
VVPSGKASRRCGCLSGLTFATICSSTLYRLRFFSSDEHSRVDPLRWVWTNRHSRSHGQASATLGMDHAVQARSRKCAPAQCFSFRCRFGIFVCGSQGISRRSCPTTGSSRRALLGESGGCCALGFSAPRVSIGPRNGLSPQPGSGQPGRNPNPARVAALPLVYQGSPVAETQTGGAHL